MASSSTLLARAWSAALASAASAGPLASLSPLARELAVGVAAGCAVYSAFYFVVSRKVTESKKRAWVPTCLAAVVSTVSGAAIALDIINNYWQPGSLVKWNPDVWVTETPVTKFACVNFLAFLVVDVVVGVFQYAKHFHLLEGWVHHAAYAAFLTHLYLSRISTAFSLFAVEELPTLILGLGTINPNWRSDKGFGATFFATRLVWHLLGSYNALTVPKGHPVGANAWFGVVSSVLHLHWFSQWCMKYLFKKPSSTENEKKAGGETNGAANGVNGNGKAKET